MMATMQQHAPAVEPAHDADDPWRSRAGVSEVRPGSAVLIASVTAVRPSAEVAGRTAMSEPLLLPMIQPMTSLRSIVRQRRLREVAAVEEGHDAVADVEDVVEAVADEDDADAVRAQVPDEVEDLARPP